MCPGYCDRTCNHTYKYCEKRKKAEARAQTENDSVGDADGALAVRVVVEEAAVGRALAAINSLKAHWALGARGFTHGGVWV